MRPIFSIKINLNCNKIYGHLLIHKLERKDRYILTMLYCKRDNVRKELTYLKVQGKSLRNFSSDVIIQHGSAVKKTEALNY